jgi:hypothetical protein
MAEAPAAMPALLFSVWTQGRRESVPVDSLTASLARLSSAGDDSRFGFSKMIARVDEGNAA